MRPRLLAFTKHLHRPNRRHVTFGLVLMISGLATLGLLYMVVAQHNGAPTAADRATLDWMLAHRDGRLVSLAVAFTHLLAPAIMLGLAAVVGGAWFITRKEVWRPLLLIGAMGVGYLLVATLKDTIARVRPPIESMITPLDISFSFPSAHTAGVALCVLIVGYLVYSRHQSKKNLLLWIDSAVLSIGIVLVTRLFLGYHWLTDVSASIGLAVFILGVVVIIDGCYTKKTLLIKQ